MKVKYIFVILLSILIIISLSQIFSIPPFADDIFEIYRSGYFTELERQFEVIKDSFLSIKMLSKPVYAWIFIDDIKKKDKIDIKIYNNRGYEVIAPGKNGDINRDVVRLINSVEPVRYSMVEDGQFYTAMPIFIEGRCRFCHESNYRGGIIGVITFKRRYDAYIYYSAERVIIFCIISMVLLFLFFTTMRWDPEKKVKELFDKK